MSWRGFQRGMMVGLALFCEKPDILEQYITILHTDVEAASINLGYHLVYYGDQAREEGYYDRGGERCNGTIQSIFRRLKNERYKNGWVLDLLTLRMLLSQRGTQILHANERFLPFLKEFLGKDDEIQGNIFQQEKQQLQEALRGVKIG